jgi:hypothetical protein
MWFLLEPPRTVARKELVLSGKAFLFSGVNYCCCSSDIEL